jgi:hypothetical protein
MNISNDCVLTIGESVFLIAPPNTIDVCPHCKRALSNVGEKTGNCVEHKEVVAVRSAVVNEYAEPDWAAS